MPINRILNFSALGLGLLLLTSAGMAQDAPIVRKGTTELGAFVGASYGTDAFRVMGGGNVSYAVTKALMPYAEFSYFPGLPRQKLLPQINGHSDYDLPLTDYHVGVHVRVPLREKRFVPYGVFGVGVIHNLKSQYSFTQTLNGVSQQVNIPLNPANSFAVNFGGGIRYYVNQKLGFRVEAKVYRAAGVIDSFFSKYEFGFFYQIR